MEVARRDANSLFLDLKLHDIPNTVQGAVAAARDQGADYVTVHTAGGTAMLEAAQSAAGGALKLLAVTLLTHLDQEDLKTLDMPGDSHRRVERWAAMARRAGCAGVVCSPLEVGDLRAENPRPFLLVTPGIRMSEEDAHDQRRTSTPSQALQVRGRSVGGRTSRDPSRGPRKSLGVPGPGDDALLSLERRLDDKDRTVDDVLEVPLERIAR